MIDIFVAVLASLTILAMGELCRWAWRVHDHIKTSRSGWPPQ